MPRPAKSRAQLRHQRARVIATRLARIRAWFGGAWGLGARGPGALHKDRFTNCSCGLCRAAKYRERRACSKAEAVRYGGAVDGSDDAIVRAPAP
jgi:hypothetical protein